MPAVKIKGTFSKNERSDNGLEEIALDLVKNEFSRHLVVGIVELHKVTKEPGEAPIPTVRFLAVEPVGDDDDAAVRGLLDRLRKSRGLGDIAETLFTAAPSGYDFDGPGDEPVEVDGQQPFRMGSDGPREVPPPSGEEVVAELAERRAAKAKGRPAADPFDAKGGGDA